MFDWVIMTATSALSDMKLLTQIYRLLRILVWLLGLIPIAVPIAGAGAITERADKHTLAPLL